MYLRRVTVRSNKCPGVHTPKGRLSCLCYVSVRCISPVYLGNDQRGRCSNTSQRAYANNLLKLHQHSISVSCCTVSQLGTASFRALDGNSTALSASLGLYVLVLLIEDGSPPSGKWEAVKSVPQSSRPAADPSYDMSSISKRCCEELVS